MKKRNLDIYAVFERTTDFETEVKLCAAAIIATEMEFRGTLYRFCEYIFAWSRLALGLSIDHLTLGVAQISVRHFKSEYGMTASEGAIASKSLKTSFHLCCSIISRLPDLGQATVLKNYNGKATGFYAKRYAQHRSDFASLLGSRLQGPG